MPSCRRNAPYMIAAGFYWMVPMARRSMTPYERPLAEPEIIPPGHPDSLRDDASARSGSLFGEHYGQRIYVAKVGPWSLMMLAALALLIAAAVVVVLIGALLIWIPIVAVLMLAGFLYGKLRQVR
jgi:hypothetical protein